MNDRWKIYHQNTKGREPSTLLSEAVSYTKGREKALDLGSGSLIESKFLLAEGFKEVTAVDKVFFEDIEDPRFTFIQLPFNEYEFPHATFDIVNAQFSLPFSAKNTFNDVWYKMKQTLVKGGIFSGQLFGINDEWNTGSKEMTFHSKDQVEKLLQDMEVLKLEEIEKQAPLANGGDKQWHIFAIIAKKVTAE